MAELARALATIVGGQRSLSGLGRLAAAAMAERIGRGNGNPALGRLAQQSWPLQPHRAYPRPRREHQADKLAARESLRRRVGNLAKAALRVTSGLTVGGKMPERDSRCGQDISDNLLAHHRPCAGLDQLADAFSRAMAWTGSRWPPHTRASAQAWLARLPRGTDRAGSSRKGYSG